MSQNSTDNMNNNLLNQYIESKRIIRQAMDDYQLGGDYYQVPGEKDFNKRTGQKVFYVKSALGTLWVQ